MSATLGETPQRHREISIRKKVCVIYNNWTNVVGCSRGCVLFRFCEIILLTTLHQRRGKKFPLTRIIMPRFRLCMQENEGLTTVENMADMSTLEQMTMAVRTDRLRTTLNIRRSREGTVSLICQSMMTKMVADKIYIRDAWLI